MSRPTRLKTPRARHPPLHFIFPTIKYRLDKLRNTVSSHDRPPIDRPPFVSLFTLVTRVATRRSQEDSINEIASDDDVSLVLRFPNLFTFDREIKWRSVDRSVDRSVVQESSFDLSTNGKLLSHDLRRSGSVEFYGNLTGTFEGNYSRGEHDSLPPSSLSSAPHRLGLITLEPRLASHVSGRRTKEEEGKSKIAFHTGRCLSSGRHRGGVRLYRAIFQLEIRCTSKGR